MMDVALPTVDYTQVRNTVSRRYYLSRLSLSDDRTPTVSVIGNPVVDYQIMILLIDYVRCHPRHLSPKTHNTPIRLKMRNFLFCKVNKIEINEGK